MSDLTTEQVAVALEVARELARAGVPVFVARPALDESGEWDPAGGHGGTGYVLPPAWERTSPDPATVDAWRPGDALGAVMGVVVDGADVDPRHGGDETAAAMQAAGAWPRSLGRQVTPSGGWHDLVNRLGVTSRDAVAPGVDVKAGLPDGTGRGFLFISPTVKLSKATGEIAPYVWTVPPMLDELDDGDDSGSTLAARIAALRAPQSDDGPDLPHDAHNAMSEAQRAAVGRYLAAVVTRTGAELTEAATWPEGHVDDRGRGWQKVIADACNRFGRLARADWTPWTYTDAEQALRPVVPRVMAAAVDLPGTWRAQRGRRDPARWPATLDTDAAASWLDSLDDLEQCAEPEAPDEPAEGEGASWAPVDLSVYLDGTYTPVVPSMLPRSDGVHLIYPGLTHSFHGESESGKSMLLQIEAARLVMAGERVLFVDFESDAGAVAERLLMFGATRAAILDRFVYVRPEVDPRSSADELAAWGRMLGGRFALAVIDGVTDSLGMFGYSTKDNDDITAWMRVVPKNIARRTGAAVAVVDHVTKDGDSRGRFAIGGQAKMSGLTGAGYTVEVAEPLGRGLRGVIVVRVGKDRPGYVRGHSGPMRKSDRTQEAARVVVDSTGRRPVVSVEPWRGHDLPAGAVRSFRPTGLMERIATALEGSPEPLSFRGINERVTGREEHIRTALNVLVDEGHVTVAEGPRKSQLHTLTRPYAQRADPLSDLYRGRETVTDAKPPLTVSVPYTGERETDTQPSPGDSRETVGDSHCLGCGDPLHRLDVDEGATRHAGCLTEAAS